jgi:peptide/nickel transport system ATP-binding protein/oligopeptide transport system ATP-binding protein
MAMLEVEDLRVSFPVRGAGGRRTDLRAVDGVTLRVDSGGSVGLVGESGCGKTTLGNAIVGLAPALAGAIRFEGEDIAGLRGRRLKAYRRRLQMVFQDPVGSLNPRMPVGSAIAEVLHAHGLARTRRERGRRVSELLGAVGLDPEYARRYPHEFSGGQRQRIGIARALAVGPSLVIADEPVSALDVSVQAQILNLLKDLREKMSLAYLLIAHDLAVVRYMCSRILVMYLGRIVESADAADLFTRPAHPYTEALISAVPDVDRSLRDGGRGQGRIVLGGDVPSPTERIPGCAFHPRCHRAREVCARLAPPCAQVGPSHTSVCHFAAEICAGAPAADLSA